MARARLRPTVHDMTHETISIRRAGADERAALLLLALLDSTPPLTGDVLIAHVGDEAWAAIEVGSGAVAADPFRPTAHVVDLLRLLAAGLRRAHGSGRTRSSSVVSGRRASWWRRSLA